MKKGIIILILIIIISSCASLTKTQIESVNSFATTTKNFSNFPSKILTELSEVRFKRGLIFATTITDPQLRKNELDSIYSQSKFDIKASEKVDVTFKIIDKYAQSLKLLSSDKHANDLDEQAQKFGIGIDSLTTLYNTIDNVNKVPTGIGNAVGQLIMLGGKQYIKAKQTKEIKKFVYEADTLMKVMTDNLLEFLESSNIQKLIYHEEKMIQLDYLSYLRQKKENSSDEYQIKYLELKNSIDGIQELNSQTIKATKELRKAHRKLTEILKEKQKIATSIKEIQTLYEQVKEMKTTVSQIENAKN